MTIQIRPLQKADRREDFQCGDPDLDLFFQRYAGQNQFRHHLGVTYVATDGESVFGFLTVASGSIEVDELAGLTKLPAVYPLPILRLGRLAVDTRYQRHGLGRQLLRYAFSLALQQRDQTGCVGIVVDARRGAVPFYQQFAFQLLEEVLEGEIRGHPPPVPMFLSIQSIQGAS
jgi:GNAT superfamily N-acetyltransferase